MGKGQKEKGEEKGRKGREMGEDRKGEEGKAGGGRASESGEGCLLVLWGHGRPGSIRTTHVTRVYNEATRGRLRNACVLACRPTRDDAVVVRICCLQR